MGWTSTHAFNYYKDGSINRKAECDTIFDRGDYTIVKSAVKGSTYYAALKNKNTQEISGMVCLTRTSTVDHFNFTYKEIWEDMGPGESNCPKSILDMLTPTQNQYANEWRQRCRNNLSKPNPQKLKIGTKIKFKTPSGTEYVLQKKAPSYGLKRNWWQVITENGNAIGLMKYPVKYLPDKFDIL